MFALSRNPITSPAALQHAFASAFPFPSALSGATRCAVAASPILSSPLASPRLNHDARYHQPTTTTTTTTAAAARPRLVPLQNGTRTQSGSLLTAFNKKAHHLHAGDRDRDSPTSPRGILLSPGTPRTMAGRRPSFALSIDLGGITDGLVGLGITPASTSATSTTTRAMVRDRIPTPYPKEHGAGGAEAEAFDWAASESAQGLEKVACGVEPGCLPKVYDDAC